MSSETFSSDFIAQDSRNRYESIEDYETRLRGIMDDYEKNRRLSPSMRSYVILKNQNDF